MLYSPITGKRVKEPYNHIYYEHKALKQPEFELRQCLYGEHLLIDKTKPVAIVEGEKTAVIASAYLPQFIWVATGGLSSLNDEKCSILKGRSVILFPDLNGFEKWNIKAKELSNLATFTVSDLLERKATEAEREQGLDLADYLIRFDFREFAFSESEATEPLPVVQPLVEVLPFEQPQTVYCSSIPEIPKPGNWDQDITLLENFFREISLPTQSVKLDNCSTITDCYTFSQNHLATVKANNGNEAFLPYLKRLQAFRQILTNKSN